jgi:hypothetical protein
MLLPCHESLYFLTPAEFSAILGVIYSQSQCVLEVVSTDSIVVPLKNNYSTLS